MKRSAIIVSAFLAAAVSLHAQDTYDAINFSENNYYGTARTIGLGNAVTALGGDLGSIGINPAGSAVYSYGQFTFTPNLSFASTKASYASRADQSYGDITRTGKTRFTLPNVGMTFNLATGSNYGLKSMTFGMVANSTALYNEKIAASGMNPYTSILGAMAYSATGYDESVLNDYGSYEAGYPWSAVLGYRSGMISHIAGTSGEYKGASEQVVEDADGNLMIGLPAGAMLNQTYSRALYGSKSDVIFNWGLNFSDRFFVGINLGIPTMTYTSKLTFNEAVPTGFEKDFTNYFLQSDGSVAEFNYLASEYSYDYMAQGDGIYGKVGLIWRPVPWLRLGAAAQTPTFFTVSESYRMGGRVFFDHDSPEAEYSPEGTYTYNLRQPWEANFGVAFTLGQLGLISVDYELQDFSVMKYMEADERLSVSQYFVPVNHANKNFTGMSHYLRAGLEVKPFNWLALRAGYTLKTSPEKYWKNNLGEVVTPGTYVADYWDYYHTRRLTLEDRYSVKANRHTFSLGAGYSSRGSFFMDAAVRLSCYPSVLYTPYQDYSVLDGEICAAPGINSFNSVVDAALTLGWRF